MPMRLFARLTGRPAGRLSATASPAVRPLPALTAARLAAAVQPTAPAETANTALTQEPLEPTQRLTAVVRAGRKVLLPGAYTVTYDRLTHHGHTAAPKPLHTRLALVTSASGLEAAIAADARRYLDGHGVIEAFVDLQVMGGHLHIDGQPIGTFTISPTRRKDQTTQPTTITENGAPTA